MPTSYNFFKQEIKQWFLENIPTSKRILDVGPGEGTYATLLHSIGYRIDAVEVYEPYVQQFGLRRKYDNVYVKDILNFDIQDYDVIILGDVLEHLDIPSAKELIWKIKKHNKQCVVAVPYTMPQGEVDGNIHEAHLQEDLTPEVMTLRYPELRCLYSNEHYGYYELPDPKLEKAFVLYATINYLKTVEGAVNALKAVSKIPIIVYLMDGYLEIEGATVVRWECNVANLPQGEFIDRSVSCLYKMMIQRPLIVKDALQKYAKIVAYIDSDSVATTYADRIFELARTTKGIPYFTEGIYDFMFSNGKGGVDPSERLEVPSCKLFNVPITNQSYRQTGYFVASEHSISFLDEWSWMCNHPEVLKNPQWYAPFHEETILNVLLWKYNITSGLPLVYMNIRLDNLDKVLKNPQWGKETDMWIKYPEKSENLLFYHGEKNLDNMNKMICVQPQMKKSMRVLFLAPHLSTGGMPAFLLKRIESLLNYDVEIFVVEWQCVSGDFVVQRNAIMKLVSNFYTLGEDKYELMKIIKDNEIDVVHIDEMIEHVGNCPFRLMSQLYANDRTWRIVETCHNVVFKPDTEKKFNPDAYAFCTPYHMEVFKNMPSYKEVIQFPIDNNTHKVWDKGEIKNLLGMEKGKKHVLNVGLWTKGKNQGEGLRIASRYPDMQFHFVGNRAGNFQDYWKPLIEHLPLNVTIWDERADVELFYQAADIFMFNSTFECSPLALREAIGYGLPIVARDLKEYGDMFTPYLQSLDTDLNIIEREYDIPEDCTTDLFGGLHNELYLRLQNKEVVISNVTVSPVKITQHFVDYPFLEITGPSDKMYRVEFYDENELCHYSTTIESNHWVRLDRRYFIKWTAKVWENDILIYQKTLDFTGQRVFISFDSSSLGDNIAWIPYVLKFKEKHNCHVIVCTFKNALFKSVYPELEFVEPGSTVHNIIAQYKIGWHYDPLREPEVPNTISLQKCASNILGLEHEEIQPRIAYKINKLPTSKPYVTIATNSTSGCKFWQKEDWQKVIDWLHGKGYEVINVSKEKNEFSHTTQLFDDSLGNTMNVIHHSKLLIGLSSGLSWLAWGMGKHTIMISNFTEKDHEYVSNCTRIVDTTVCHGCWNRPDIKFDKGDWDWCPIHKGTSRQWECQKAITGEQVIEKLQNLL